ncbi:GIY-YIG nuclease family protein [Variovorax sp. GT1P44]|uniref:GIY-YIG nuclease family protein n=1 Tax=Variovorax sp. GT1P44 TaxID=3443742 RepID=UPI003F44DF87
MSDTAILERRIPDWLAPHKNEWRSRIGLGALFIVEGRPFSAWMNEIQPRLRCVSKESTNGKSMARYYLVKQVWAFARAHGLTIKPAAPFREDRERILELENRVADLQRRLIAAESRPPEVRLVRNPNAIPMLTSMLTTTEAKPLPGVYFLISEGVVTYVGQSQNVLARMSGHRGKRFDAVKMIHEPDMNALSPLEDRWIQAFAPRDNVRGLEHMRAEA